MHLPDSAADRCCLLALAGAVGLLLAVLGTLCYLTCSLTA